MPPETTSPEQTERQLLETRGIARGPANFVLTLFALTLLGVPGSQSLLGDGRPLGALVDLIGDARETAGRAPGATLRDTDRDLLAAMNRFERRLEEESVLRDLFLAPVQRMVLAWGGWGNEQVVPGLDGWLFYRDDIDSVVGRGFLDAGVAARRALEGDAWNDAPVADPVGALVDLDRQLSARGIELVVLPAPVKPTIHPEKLTASRAAEPVQNPSFPAWLRRLEEAGVAVLDPAPALWAAKAAALDGGAGDGDVYLTRDTHWSPRGVEVVAGQLAAWLGERGGLTVSSRVIHMRRPVVTSSPGDTFSLLRLPTTPEEAQSVRSQRVLSLDGESWRPDPAAEVLLLGDSFSNVFSDPSLGWGAGAGLAEQLSFELRAPVDRIAVNAGGALGARRALARQLERDSSRLAGKKFVVYQFATRELSQGDWRSFEVFDGPHRAARPTE